MTPENNVWTLSYAQAFDFAELTAIAAQLNSTAMTDYTNAIKNAIQGGQPTSTIPGVSLVTVGLLDVPNPVTGDFYQIVPSGVVYTAPPPPAPVAVLDPVGPLIYGNIYGPVRGMVGYKDGDSFTDVRGTFILTLKQTGQIAPQAWWTLETPVGG